MQTTGFTSLSHREGHITDHLPDQKPTASLSLLSQRLTNSRTTESRAVSKLPPELSFPNGQTYKSNKLKSKLKTMYTRKKNVLKSQCVFKLGEALKSVSCDYQRNRKAIRKFQMLSH